MGMDVAGWVLLGIVVLILLYILPAMIRGRQVVVDSRVDDRFSADLRIVSRTGVVQEVAADRTARGYVHRRGPNEETPMNSPADLRLAAADARRVAAARAARAAAASRRAAAARRRLVLTTAVAALAAGAWIGVTLTPLPLVAGVLPTLLLVGLVVVGRRAATAGAAADARFRADVAAARPSTRSAPERVATVPRLRVDVDPSALLPETAAAELPVDLQEARTRPAPVEPGWTPVPVPPPAYTLKRAAPRRQPAPYAGDAPTEQHEPVAAPSAVAERPDADDAAEQARTEVAPATPPAIDVQAVLARRRAAG